ncbi:ATPase [Pseudomonas sp. OTU750018]|uniref:ATPase n=1 Tax=Pseudomonas sp. OTU750018 TaxID=2709708 RepID=UPI001F5113C9|nr:ATPase [Pseudomonas sp. OTU750018]
MARKIDIDRKQINQILFSNPETFSQDRNSFGWYLLKDHQFVLELTANGTWLSHQHFEKALLKFGSPLDSPLNRVVIKVLPDKKLLFCAAARILALANQLVAAGKHVVLDFTDNNSTVSYLGRACFFARLNQAVDVLPSKPDAAFAELYLANNLGLVELLEICPEVNVPERIKLSFEEAFGSRDANKLFTLVGEMVCNVEDHSDTLIPGFAGLQCYEMSSRKSVVVVVSDSGRGICQTLRPGLEEHFPDVAREFSPTIKDADPLLILRAMEEGGLSRLGKGRGAGFHTSHEEAAKLSAKVTIRQDSFAVYLKYKEGKLERKSWKTNLPRLVGTHIVFEFSLTAD